MKDPGWRRYVGFVLFVIGLWGTAGAMRLERGFERGFLLVLLANVMFYGLLFAVRDEIRRIRE